MFEFKRNPGARVECFFMKVILCIDYSINTNETLEIGSMLYEKKLYRLPQSISKWQALK